MKMGLYAKDANIGFILTQSLSESRLNLAMETEKYANIFGNSFLKSSIILATKVDRLDPSIILESIQILKKDMSDKLNTNFPIQQFSSESQFKDKQISVPYSSLSNYHHTPTKPFLKSRIEQKKSYKTKEPKKRIWKNTLCLILSQRNNQLRDGERKMITFQE